VSGKALCKGIVLHAQLLINGLLLGCFEQFKNMIFKIIRQFSSGLITAQVVGSFSPVFIFSLFCSCFKQVLL
jgi:hypothetical protein